MDASRSRGACRPSSTRLQSTGIALKVNASNGAEIWRHAYDTSTANTARFESVAATPDGGFVLAGTVAAVSAQPPVQDAWDALLIKTDAAGNELWRRTYGGSEHDEALAVGVTADQGLLLAGYTRSYGGTVNPQQGFMWDDVFMIRLDAAGNTLWRKAKGSRYPTGDGAGAMTIAADGGFVVGGSSDGNVMLAKFDKNGVTVNLGANDTTYTVPATNGIVHIGNAVDVAAAGLRALAGPRQVGGAALDLLIDAAQGAPVADYCAGGGSYTFVPPVPATPAAGLTTTLTFTDCVVGPVGDQSRLNGTTTVAITLLSGALTSPSYTVQTTLSAVDLQIADTGGTLTSRITGGLHYLRSAAAGAFSEVSGSISSPSAQTLTFAETGGTARTAVLGPFTVRSSVTSGGATSIGATIDTITVAAGGHSFAVEVLQPLQAPSATADPTSGSFRVGAVDGSKVMVGASGGNAALAVDSDGDGTVDGTLSVPWVSID